MNQPPQLTHYRLDDLPLVLGLLLQMNFPVIYDREIRDHMLHTGLSGGWMMTIWLAFIITRGDHTKYKVEEWVERHQDVIAKVTGQVIDSKQFSDNRLSSLLTRLSSDKRWDDFEATLWQHDVEVFEICPASVGDLVSAHVDSTTACGYHTPSENGLMQRGHSKDHRPDLAQLKLMTVAFHPHGQLAATQVVSGQTADDGLYLPIIGRARAMVGHAGVLYSGDSKMAALATRAEIARAGDYYLTIAPLTGETAKALPGWIEAAVNGQQPTVELINEAGQKIGRGYEFERECKIELPIGPGGALTEFTFSERVLVMRSESLLKSQAGGLAKRLKNASQEVQDLTPEPGRGHRQYRDEESLQEAVNQVIEKHRVAGLLEVEWEIEEQRERRFVGRGRGGANRKHQEIITRRVQITSVKRKKAAIAAYCKRLGWRAQLTNAPLTISLNQCVNHYRANWRGERNYHRFKSQPIGIDTIYVHNDDQITGLTRLLTLAARAESIMEWEVERGLKSEEKVMKGLYAGQPQRATATPTAVAMLEAISRSEITLTQLESEGQTISHLTPLPQLVLDVLRYLHLPLTLYTGLGAKPAAENSVFDISIFGK
ncbi:MAG: transposase [Acidobacteria bacterium]|nr:transposase [Acidobacteriota bacterium]